ncbi:MAG: hypothetical protein NTZ01_01720 [Verrucomicrobia bacterium]|nr:hypothetical protein [Verrucomicrobiota bacterium]
MNAQVSSRGPAQADALEADALAPGFGERVSPEENYSSKEKRGLSERAIPVQEMGEDPENSAQTLYRLIRPYYDNIFAERMPLYAPTPDPSTFRPVRISDPPLGLFPKRGRPGLVEVYLWAGVAQSYDSNVKMTATNPIADYFFTPRAGIEVSVGTPETILGLQFAYEAYEDFFYENPNLNAFNQKLDLATRIGRDDFVWRPYLAASDLTGSNLLLDEQTNRTRRVRILPGINGDYQFTKCTGMNQSFSFFSYQHPNGNGFINLQSYDTRQELNYLLFHDLKILAWGEYRYSAPSQGVGASEIFFGTGWRGRPDPRIYSEMRFGYDFLMPNSSFNGRKDLSGFRFNGYTTFEWSPRFRPTLKYDRDYVFTEFGVNDNYTATLLQLRLETFMGQNWYLTPYCAFGFFEYEIGSQYAFQIRPEIELAYALPSTRKTSQPRAFLKFGYQGYDITEGAGPSISGIRVAAGFEWKF